MLVLYESKIRLGHPSWISGPLMEKLAVSRGEIAFGFPPILWPDFRLVPLVSRSPEDDLETCAMTVFVSLASNVIHREIARSKLQITQNSKLQKVCRKITSHLLHQLYSIFLGGIMATFVFLNHVTPRIFHGKLFLGKGH